MCARRGQERKKAIMIADICLLKNEEYRFVCCCDLIITRCRCCYYGSSSVCEQNDIQLPYFTTILQKRRGAQRNDARSASLPDN